MEERKELWLKTFMFFPFRIIASFLSALSMDEKGFSLKKILACFGTVVAAKVTLEHACKENAIAFTIVWLLWVLVVIGIYSAKDVKDLVGLAKGNKIEETKTVEQTKTEETKITQNG